MEANRKSLMSRIFEDSMQFILDLMIATSQNVSLDETSLDDLFREDEYRVMNQNGVLMVSRKSSTRSLH